MTGAKPKPVRKSKHNLLDLLAPDRIREQQQLRIVSAKWLCLNKALYLRKDYSGSSFNFSYFTLKIILMAGEKKFLLPNNLSSTASLSFFATKVFYL